MGLTAYVFPDDAIPAYFSPDAVDVIVAARSEEQFASIGRQIQRQLKKAVRAQFAKQLTQLPEELA